MLRFWMLRTFDALIVSPMRGSFLPRSYRSIHQARGVFSTVLLKSVAVCFYAEWVPVPFPCCLSPFSLFAQSFFPWKIPLPLALTVLASGSSSSVSAPSVTSFSISSTPVSQPVTFPRPGNTQSSILSINMVTLPKHPTTALFPLFPPSPSL